MARQFEKVHTRRIIALILLCVILFLTGAMRLFDYQLVNGESYLAAAQRSSYTTIKIPAARGEIIDRNGVPFTKNKAAFNVEFDYTFLPKKRENEIIYSLIKTFEAMGEEWVDNLPVTMTTPYEFLPDRDTDIKRLKNKLEVNDYATAQNCMDALFELNDKRYSSDPEYKDKDITGIEYLNYTPEYQRKLAGVRYEMIVAGFSGYTPRYTFAEDISPKTVAFLKELSDDFPGVEIMSKAIRTYVGGDVASHLIGTIGPMYAEDYEHYKTIEGGDYQLNDSVGKSGIEKAFENELRGKNGEMKVIKNTQGDVIDIIETTEPVAGKTIQLSIDYNFNKEVQQLLADFILNFNETNKEGKKSEAAAVVVLDTKTGGVLASASYPYYNLADYYKSYSSVASAPGKPLNNRALNGLYRPGSTFKPVVAAAGLTEGKVTPQTGIYCDGFYHYWPNWNPLPKCLGTNHLRTSPDTVTALKWSCNVYFYETGRLLGIEKMNEYAEHFGFGTDTGLEISNAKGNLSSRAYSQSLGVRWEEGNVIQAAIGQMDTQVTPLQMAVEAMTIANRGTRYNTHLLKSVLTHDQTEVLQAEQTTVASSFDMSDSTFDAISQGMIGAASTVRAPYQLTDLGYDVAVKTGTPQVTKTKFNNASIAFAPVSNPEISIAIMMEDGLYTNNLIRSILEAYQKSKTSAQK